MNKIRLHLGCGNNKIKGWINIDKYRNSDIIDDIITLKNFKDNSISEIYTSHVIEHIEPEDFIKALNRWYKLLKNGGVLTIRCPDGEYILKRYLNVSDKEKLNDIILLNKKGYLRGIFGKRNKGEGYKNRN
jgi:predicted SAM-dependent methyltransferase